MEELARYLDVKVDNLTLGFGSTEILQIAVQAFQGPNTPLIIAQPTFEDISDYQDTMPFEVEAIPLTKDLQHDIGRMRESSMRRPSVVYFVIRTTRREQSHRHVISMHGSLKPLRPRPSSWTRHISSMLRTTLSGRQ